MYIEGVQLQFHAFPMRCNLLIDIRKLTLQNMFDRIVSVAIRTPGRFVGTLHIQSAPS